MSIESIDKPVDVVNVDSIFAMSSVSSSLRVVASSMLIVFVVGE